MAGSRMISFPQDSVILREGEENTEMFKILKGNVELYVGYGTPLESLLGIIGKQACFGEFGLLLGKPAIYTAVAYSDVLAMRIGEDELEDFIRDNHGNIITIMRNMAGSMLTMKTQIELLLQELQDESKTRDGSKVNGNDVQIKDAIRDARQAMRMYAVYKNGSDWSDAVLGKNSLNRKA